VRLPFAAIVSVGCMEPEGARRPVSTMGIIGEERAQTRQSKLSGTSTCSQG
jgi:hypothetical protein